MTRATDDQLRETVAALEWYHTIELRPGVATLVGFADQEPLFGALRRRQIITDSPRIIADRRPLP